jgi:hypothetical protein
LFTSIPKLEKLQASSMKSTSSMASFCLDCIATRQDFATRLYGLFEHEAEGPLQSQEMAYHEHRSGPSTDIHSLHRLKHRRLFEVCASYDLGCYVSLKSIFGLSIGCDMYTARMRKLRCCVHMLVCAMSMMALSQFWQSQVFCLK